MVDVVLEPAVVNSDPTVKVETIGLPVHVPDPKHGVSPTDNVTVENILQHPNTHPVALDLILLKKYGPEFLMWDIETLLLRIPKDFGTSVSELNLNKIGALKTLHLVDTFWQRWEVFNWCTSAFNGNYPDFEVMQVPTVAQCIISVDVANRIRTDVEWSSEVKSFIASAHIFEGVLLTLPPVDFVTLDTSAYDVDVSKLRYAWANRTSQSFDVDSVEGEQLGRLSDVQSYMMNARKSLKLQLKVVEHV